MPCGIYIIRFNNTDKVYIGQSKAVEARILQHLSKLRNGKSPAKLQDAYNQYGIKDYETLIECEPPELDSLEKEAIEIFDSFNNGFNSLPDSSPPILDGELSGNALETNEVYKDVLRLLVQRNPTLNKRQISEMTGVSIYIVRHIAALESHGWLKEAMPEEYRELERIKFENKYYYGTQYPDIKSPDGKIYSVTHVSNFAKEHGLLQPKLTEVLRGTRKVHKGWTLA